LCRILRQDPRCLQASPDEAALPSCLLRGFPDRVAQATPQRDRPNLFRFCRGGGGELLRHSLAAGQGFILCLSLRERLNADRSERLLIERAAALSISEILASNSPLLRTQNVVETSVNHQPINFRVQFYGELELSRQRLQEVAESGSLADRLIAAWPAPFGSAEPLELYHSRARLFNQHNPEELPIFEGEMLELFLSSIASDYGSWRQLSETPLRDLIVSQLDYHLAQQLDEQCPEQLTLENGKQLRVDYSATGGPLLRGAIQDFYGCHRLPSLCQGAVRLGIELLGPNKRPVQRTSDLQSFWSKTYPELLREYQRNYPRHYWPADPQTAKPYLLVRHLPKST
jgi:ATP-dependent helicase HrpB